MPRPWSDGNCAQDSGSMLPILLALIIFFADFLVAVIVYNSLLRRGHPHAFAIAGFILLAGIVSAIMIWIYLPMAIGETG